MVVGMRLVGHGAFLGHDIFEYSSWLLEYFHNNKFSTSTLLT